MKLIDRVAPAATWSIDNTYNHYIILGGTNRKLTISTWLKVFICNDYRNYQYNPTIITTRMIIIAWVLIISWTIIISSKTALITPSSYFEIFIQQYYVQFYAWKIFVWAAYKGYIRQSRNLQRKPNLKQFIVHPENI